MLDSCTRGYFKKGLNRGLMRKTYCQAKSGNMKSGERCEELISFSYV